MSQFFEIMESELTLINSSLEALCICQPSCQVCWLYHVSPSHIPLVKHSPSTSYRIPQVFRTGRITTGLSFPINIALISPRYEAITTGPRKPFFFVAINPRPLVQSSKKMEETPRRGFPWRIYGAYGNPTSFHPLRSLL